MFKKRNISEEEKKTLPACSTADKDIN